MTDVSKTADLVLQLTKQENLSEANQILESFNHTWQSVNHEQSPFFDTESEQAISLTLQQAQVALQSTDMEQVERVTESQRLDWLLTLFQTIVNLYGF